MPTFIAIPQSGHEAVSYRGLKINMEAACNYLDGVLFDVKLLTVFNCEAHHDFIQWRRLNEKGNHANK